MMDPRSGTKDMEEMQRISYKAIQLNDNGFLLVGESRSSVGGDKSEERYSI